MLFLVKNIAQMVTYDLIIIGGGITGAAVAYEASSRGLKVALFEKGDFGGATSAATSKLIHGGLRYLKNLELGLVRESLQERRILENIAPNFVYPLSFMIPSYKSLKSRKATLFIGMVLYELLSFDKGFTWDKTKKLPGFNLLSRKKTLKSEPCIKQEGLTGSTIYYDCQSIFPARLTLSFIKSAIYYGALASNYTKVESIIRDGNKVVGVTVRDLTTNKEKKIRASLVINCAGPWADILLNRLGKNETKYTIKRSEGIHIITKKICKNHAVTVFKKDNKHIMIMPWRNHSLIGTTDKEYHGHPDDYKFTHDRVLELIEAVNQNYEKPALSFKDVLFAYGGLRPLADDYSHQSYEISRKYEIIDNAEEGLNGLITVEGGKYTTSRNLAVSVVKIIKNKLKKKILKSISNSTFLKGCEIKNMDVFLKELHMKYPTFSGNTIDYLGKNYGLECHQIFKLAKENKDYAEVLNADGEILAEVYYAIKNEMAKTLPDILFRRTGIGTLGHPGKTIMKKVADLSGSLLNWDKKQREAEIQKAEKIFTLPK